MRRIAAAAAVAAGIGIVLVPTASADHHAMLIRELYPGTAAATRDDAFIELQMYAAGQNFVGGHHVDVYGPGPSGASTYTFSAGSVASGQDQRTVLAGGALVTDRDKSEDIGASVNPAGGAICFRSSSGFGVIDCVEWGSGNDTINAGTPVQAAGITDGMSVTRSITPGCSTLLQSTDDTNDSAANFSQTSPTPRNNATVPTETDCMLSVNRIGGGVGVVMGNGINCGSDCSQSYADGPSVVLTATADGPSGSSFDVWQGPCDSNPIPTQCQVDMAVSKSITAVFDGPTMPQLTVMRGGTGSGTVMGTGIACGADCMEEYPNGNPVSLAATPDAGSAFVGWTGCPSGAGTNPCTYNADINRTITATFSLSTPTMNPPPVIPTTPATTTATPPKKCKKGFVKRKGKCRKKRK